MLITTQKVADEVETNEKERQRLLSETIAENPFVTDEQLATQFQVSVQTIRLDRMELSIPELRERIKDVASKAMKMK